jgi:hypothetical protein
VNHILENQESYKREKYEDQYLRSICNKFVNNYFYTIKGIEFCRNNPSANFMKSKVDEETLKELQELGKETNKMLKIGEDAIQMRLTAENQQKSLNDKTQGAEREGNGIEEGKNGKPYRIKKNLKGNKSITKIMEEEHFKRVDDEKRKNLEYLFKMNKSFDVYGQLRKPLPPIPSMLKAYPQFELNDKQIEVEGPTDKRIKISSMCDRLYILAPSTDSLRNEGMHQSLIRTMDKGNSHKDLMSRKKLMPESIRSDKLERDFIIYPEAISFGSLKVGGLYRTELMIVNDNYFLQRVKLVQPIEAHFQVKINITGPIAMGQERQIIVSFDGTSLPEGTYESEFFILSKYRKYRIPISACLSASKAAEGKLNEQMQKEALTGSLQYKLYKTQFEVREDNKGADDLHHTRSSNDGTGTITHDNLPKMTFDRNVRLNTELPEIKKKKPTNDYYEDEGKPDPSANNGRNNLN